MAVAHRIYAEALFGAAKDAGRLAQVHEALGDFASAVAESPELRAVLRNPQLEPTAKATILDDLAGDEEPLFANFLQLAAEKGRAGELEEIAKEFERLMAREERRLTVELTTARELTDCRGQGDHRADRGRGGPRGRCDAEGRPRPRRRHRPAGGLAPRRRERARATGTVEKRTREDMRELRAL